MFLATKSQPQPLLLAPKLEDIGEASTPDDSSDGDLTTSSQKSINPFFTNINMPPKKPDDGKMMPKTIFNPLLNKLDFQLNEGEPNPLTPTTLQHNLCLNATSEINVDLTDEEEEEEDAESSDKDENIAIISQKSKKSIHKHVSQINSASMNTLNGSLKPLKIATKKRNCSCDSSFINTSVMEIQPPPPPLVLHQLQENYFPSKTTPITDEYKITHEIIGIGESGKVMACFSHSNNQKYALKVLRDGPRSRREVYLHYLTNTHKNIVSIIDIFENTFDNVKCLLVVVEFLEGGDLLTRFESQDQIPFTEKQVANIIRQIGSAVQYLHERSIAHRDIKLENILCSISDVCDENCIFKLGDFGFAKCSERNNLMESPCCTPAYVCPEILSHERYDKSCDLWAIGVVMYILLCGYPPFYSMKGLPFSPGMKDRITVGLYAFPHEDWDWISTTTKNVIRNLLKTDPATRTTIQELMLSPFIQSKNSLPIIYSGCSLSSLMDETPTTTTTTTTNRNFDDDSPPFGGGGDENDDENCLSYNFDTIDSSNLASTEIDIDDKPIHFSFSSETLKFAANKNDKLINFDNQKRQQKKNSLNLANKQQQQQQYSLNTISAQTFSIEKSSSSLIEENSLKNQRKTSIRPYSIQEEVGRALDMLRLGGNNCYIKSLKIATGNHLLARRRAATIAAVELVAQKI